MKNHTEIPEEAKLEGALRMLWQALGGSSTREAKLGNTE